jgi:hypothetical protein
VIILPEFISDGEVIRTEDRNDELGYKLTSGITDVFTSGSMYDNNSINVKLDGEYYKIRCSDLKEMLQSANQVVGAKKARKHTYLKLHAAERPI